MKNEYPNFVTLWQSYQYKARKRGISWRLSKVEFAKLTKGRCYICGSEPKSVYRHQKAKTTYDKGYIYNGIDRVDSKKGYTIENSKSCCSKCNWIKLNWSLADLKKHITKMFRGLP